MVIPIETLGDRFEKENPGMEEFDHVAWREYFEKWEKFHTYCLTCMAKKKEEQKGDAGILDISASSSEEEEDDGARFGQVSLNAASAALARRWLRLAQARVRRRGGRVSASAGDVSDDDIGEDLGPEWARHAVRLNAASTAIALRWLQLARAGRAQSGGRTIGAASRGLRDERKKPQKHQKQSGIRSVFNKK